MESAFVEPPAIDAMVRRDDVRIDLVDPDAGPVLVETAVGIVEVPRVGVQRLIGRGIGTPAVLVADDSVWLGGVSSVLVEPPARPLVLIRCEVLEVRAETRASDFAPRGRYSMEGDPPPPDGGGLGAAVAAIKKAADPQTELPVLRSFLDSEDPTLREFTCSRSRLPAAILRLLAREDSAATRSAVARNPALPTDIAEALVNDPDRLVRAALAANPAIPVMLLTQLARDGRGEVRGAAASNSALPLPLLEELAADVDWQVRTGAARNEHLPEFAVRALFEEGHPAVLENLAACSVAAPDVLRELAVIHPDLVADNWAAPEDVLAVLSESGDQQIREHVARNPTTPGNVLSKLAKDSEDGVRREVRDNPSAPPTVRRRLIKAFPD